MGQKQASRKKASSNPPSLGFGVLRCHRSVNDWVAKSLWRPFRGLARPLPVLCLT